MKLHPVKSSHISHVGHDPDKGRMIVQFARSGARYVYENVTAADHAALVGAPSVGSHFIAKIKSNPTAFPYSKHDAAVHGAVEIHEAAK